MLPRDSRSEVPSIASAVAQIVDCPDFGNAVEERNDISYKALGFSDRSGASQL